MALAWIATPKKRRMLRVISAAAAVSRLGRKRGKPTLRPEAEIENILVVELWNIGDVILLLPFLAQLRKIFPRASVTLLGRKHARELLEASGFVDEFIEADLAWTQNGRKYNPLAYDWRAMLRIARSLRRKKFDVAFECRMHVREQVVLALSGAERRIGYAFEGDPGVLTDALDVTDDDRHKVDDWLRLLEPFGGAVNVPQPRLELFAAERASAKELLAALGVRDTDVVVGIHPGASVPEKRWPLERFALIAESLASRDGIRVLAFSDPSGYGAEIGEIPGVVPIAVGLRELAAIIERCNLLVCNDSGPMHIAGALGVPTVAIFGSGVDRWFSPLGTGHRLLSREMECRPCYDGCRFAEPFCLTGLQATSVLQAIEDALGSISLTK